MRLGSLDFFFPSHETLDDHISTIFVTFLDNKANALSSKLPFLVNLSLYIYHYLINQAKCFVLSLKNLNCKSDLKRLNIVYKFGVFFFFLQRLDLGVSPSYYTIQYLCVLSNHIVFFLSIRKYVYLIMC